MQVFIKYLVINLLLIFFHVLMFFVGVMGFGGGTGNESRIVLLQALLMFSFFGASPNLFIFLVSLIRGRKVKENALWTTVFMVLVMVAYFITFWSVLE